MAITQAEVLPEVSLIEDPCIHRLVQRIHNLFPRQVLIAVAPAIKDGIETYELKVVYNDHHISGAYLLTHVKRVGSLLLRDHKHAYWAIYQSLSKQQKEALLKGVSSIPGESFVAIDGHGFLCVEYSAGAKEFEAHLNAYLDEFFKRITLNRLSNERAPSSRSCNRASQ